MDPLFEKRDLRVVVTGRNLGDLLPMLRQFPIQVVETDPDLVISYGGDGSLLGAAASAGNFSTRFTPRCSTGISGLS